MSPRVGSRAPLAGVIAAALVAAALVAGPADAVQTSVRAGTPQAATLSRGPGCAWTYFTDPRAVAVHGITYVGCTTGDGRARVLAVRKGTVVSGATLMSGLRPDDHDNPSLLVRPDGRLTAFWSPHSGYHRPRTGPSRLYYRTTSKPLRPSGVLPGFGATKRIPTNTGANRLGYTYSHPVRAGSRTWLFWRGGNWFPSYSFTTASGGWSKARTLIRGRGVKNRPYAKYASDGHNGVLVAYSDGNPSRSVNDVRFARIKNRSLLAADGRVIGTVGRKMAVRDGDLVHRHLDGENTWVMDVAADDAGNPIIVYISLRGLRSEFRYARWDGSRWVDHPVAPAAVDDSPERAAGATIDHDDPATVLLSRRADPSRAAAPEMWTTPDGGDSWTHRRLAHAGATDALRPISPVGLHGTGEVYWFDGRHRRWSDFDTRLRIWNGG